MDYKYENEMNHHGFSGEQVRKRTRFEKGGKACEGKMNGVFRVTLESFRKAPKIISEILGSYTTES